MNRSPLLGVFLRLGLAGLVCLTIYLPHLAHFRIPKAGAVAEAAIARLISEPDDQTLSEIADYQFAIRSNITQPATVSHARTSLGGAAGCAGPGGRATGVARLSPPL